MSRFRDERRASIGYRIARLFRMNAAILERKVSPLGVAYGQIPYVLMTVEHGEQTQDHMSAKLHVNRAATARTLKKLEAEGFITREENPECRRQKLVRPTEKAEGIAHELQDLLTDFNGMLIKGISEDEKAQLFGLLDRVIVNAEEMLEEGDSSNG